MSEIKLPEGIFGIKYRTKWAWGNGQWEWVLYLGGMTREDAESNAQCICEDANQEDHHRSDKYRGVEYEILTEYPRERLVDRKAGMLVQIEDLKNEVKLLETILGESA